MQYKTLILGAGAAGMMCAIHAGASTLVIDHAKSPGDKIRISGGGRCNFTNLDVGFENFISENKHFHKSALTRYTQWDFIDLIATHGIAYHEKTLGQLFCDGKATQVVDMLRDEMTRVRAEIRLQTSLVSLTKSDTGFIATLETDGKRVDVTAQNVVLATGGKSIPKMGATGLAYTLAQQFDHAVTAIRPGLVPFTFPEGRFAALSGTALPVHVRTQTANGMTQFPEALLFTHRGLSGPAILQISSYWRDGAPIEIDFFPNDDPYETLRNLRTKSGRKNLSTVLGALMPSRLAEYFTADLRLSGNLADQSDTALRALADQLTNYQLTPSGTEGYRTAEVTIGGIDTDQINSKTMMSKSVPGLYFIGECVDVTGWLGGYNFQWAWSSGAAAGRDIAAQ